MDDPEIIETQVTRTVINEDGSITIIGYPSDYVANYSDVGVKARGDVATDEVEIPIPVPDEE